MAEDGGALDLSHLFTSGEEIDTSSFIINRTGMIELTADDEASEGSLSASKILVNTNLEEAELAMLRSALKESRGNLSKASRILGISRAKLAYRLQKHGIPIDE